MTLNEIIKECVQIALETNEVFDETVIFGAESKLESIGLVSLLVDIEQKVYEEFQKEITIASKKAMSRNRSPFRTVRSLTEFIEELLT